MALDDLIKHMEAEVNAEIAKIRSWTKNQILEIDAQWEETQKRLNLMHQQKLEVAKNSKLGAALTNAKIKSRIDLLNAKRKILDDFYKNLSDRILSLGEEAKKEIYLKLASTLVQSEKAKLVVSKNDSALWKKAKDRIKHGKFEESDDFSGGFIYACEKSVVDYTFENIFKNFRQNSEMEVARKLFE